MSRRRRRNLWPGLRRVARAAAGEAKVGQAASDDAGSAEAEEVDSPCTGVCRIDAGGLCLDCLRTVDEIAAWSRLDALQRRRVMDVASRRRDAG